MTDSNKFRFEPNTDRQIEWLGKGYTVSTSYRLIMLFGHCTTNRVI